MPTLPRCLGRQLWCLPFSSAKPCRRRLLHTRTLALAGAEEHARYIDEIAMASRPARVATLLKVLNAQGHEIVSPADRTGLHPLVVPLSKHAVQPAPGDASVIGNETFTCLLRWPESKRSIGMPVVQMSRNAPSMRLVARTTDEYLHRALAEEDVASGPGQIAEAAGPSGREVYVPGAVASAKQVHLQAYLTRRAGMYIDVVEQLMANHLSKGDTMSALITGEWYMRSKHFPGWARPFEANALLFQDINRMEEARDTARIALRMPWWTLLTGFQKIRDLAELSGDADAVANALSEETAAASGPVPGGNIISKDAKQLALEKADRTMNRSAAGSTADWDSIRGQLADEYRAAGLSDVAEFILAAEHR
ncbi:hypothetical protein WJX72_007933 [[Myrmecia] bisecta]|uniref:Uncharacterized protein n=1 Tax=[Myrmecia] bisecta TaxID=41462 RepID=A0AAW1PKP1_9CHLO